MSVQSLTEQYSEAKNEGADFAVAANATTRNLSEARLMIKSVEQVKC